eukprot:scaffold264722_cov30-Tisochrysis_lutea.AAC.1
MRKWKIDESSRLHLGCSILNYERGLCGSGVGFGTTKGDDARCHTIREGAVKLGALSCFDCVTYRNHLLSG